MAKIIECKKDIAVIGAGHWGKNYVRILNDCRRLHTVCDWNSPEELGCAVPPAVGFTHNLNEITKNPQIKGVVIATVTEHHYDIAKQLLLAGKNVLVEKPMCMDSDTAKDLKVIAERENCILMVGHLLRYHPGFVQMEKMVREGVIGEVKYIYANRLNLGKIREVENVWWSFAPHDISMMQALTMGSKTKWVSAAGWHGLGRKLVDSTHTYIVFENGVHGHIFVSWLHPMKRHELVCIGEKGMIKFEDNVEPEDQIELWMGGNGTAKEKVKQDQIWTPATNEPLKEEINHFLDAIICKTKNPDKRITVRTNAQEGIDVVRVLEQAEASMKINESIIREVV